MTKKTNNNDVEQAILELNDVLKLTEESAEKIIDSTESIREIASNSSDKDIGNKIEQFLYPILEACNSQDLNGQRIKKSIKTLDDIKNSGNIVSNSPEPQNSETNNNDHLKNGPQLSEDAPSQDDIDKLFN